MSPPAECYARLEGDLWIVGNARIERRWRVIGDALFAVSLRDKTTGRDWLAGQAGVGSLVGRTEFSGSPLPPRIWTDDSSPVAEPSLVADLPIETAAGQVIRRFRISTNAPAITLQLITPLTDAVATEPAQTSSVIPTGNELADSHQRLKAIERDVLDAIELQPGHYRLSHITLKDQTDEHGNLGFETDYFLDATERTLQLQGVLFAIEDVLTGEGLVMIKHAPLPHARPVKEPIDLAVLNQFEIGFLGHGTADGGEGYPFAIIPYRDARPGRTAALQAYQRQFRNYHPERDGLLVTNTWGDRSRDGRISAAFMSHEITAAADLHADVIQIDDGWQAGKTSNSVDPTGGVWQGYWDVSKTFWHPHATRFPEGLTAIVEKAGAVGLQFGLWFSPDSADDFAHWQDDADTLLRLEEELGVSHFKIDGVKSITKTGERNLFKFFDTVLRESDGRITFDLDVTAEIRPGYFALPQIGPLFVENRYTDLQWRRYHPHHTLRTLWTLSQYIDPVRLRMEFLNNARNAEAYQNDPLAPAAYRPETLFAITMFSSPLGWFEASNLPADYLASVGALVQLWRSHRAQIHCGTILPIGAMPDGVAWTGFASVGEKAVHLVLFRELNAFDHHTFEVPLLPSDLRKVEILAGSGAASVAGRCVTVTGVDRLGFLWIKASV